MSSEGMEHASDAQPNGQLSFFKDHYRLFLDSIADALFINEILADRTLGPFLETNSEACHLLGYTREELGKLSFRDVAAPESSIDFRMMIERLGQEKKCVFEQLFMTKQGQRIPVEIHASTIPSRDHVMVMALVRNISEHKRIQDILREETRLFVAGPLVALKWKPAGRWPIEFISPNVFAHFGYTPAAFVNGAIPFMDIIHPDDLERVKRNIDDGVNAGRSWYEQDYRLKRADGQYRWIHDFTVIVHDRSGAITDFYGYLQDVTDKMVAEWERHRLETHIRRAQNLESLGLLAGGMAHDYNNILQSILGFTELTLTMMEDNNPLRSNLDEVMKATRRAAELTNQLLAYSGQGQLITKSVNINEIIRTRAADLGKIVKGKALLSYDLADDLPFIHADVSQIAQVLINLVDNAAEAITQKGGIITITTGLTHCDKKYLQSPWIDDDRPSGNYVCVRVDDTGNGMDPLTLNKIFSPFFSTKFSGRGLGLSAVLGIMRTHKGSIKIDSKQGKGTSVKLYFPESIPKIEAARANVHPRISPYKRTILLADDESGIRDVGRVMVEMLGYKALVASSGYEAIELYRANASDIACVILDLTMPGMDGITTCEELQRIDGDVCVILSSGYRNIESEKRFKDIGIVSFLEKPYEMSALREKIESLLTTEL